MRESGTLFHAKHAFMPNSLGYCGPDQNGVIQQHLEDGKVGEGLVRTLQGFEAAYPFLRLIARNAGKDVFDYSVPEAYWIGNSLLGEVSPEDFYDFTCNELVGMGSSGIRENFRNLGGGGIPHHTFYVMGTYVGAGPKDGPNPIDDGAEKVAHLIDNCRISWGKVEKVEGRNELAVRYRPVEIGEDGLGLAPPKLKRVRYNPEVKPFDSIAAGDVVSIHWEYACDILSPRQIRNISKYTYMDLKLINRLQSGPGRRGRR